MCGKHHITEVACLAKHRRRVKTNQRMPWYTTQQQSHEDPSPNQCRTNLSISQPPVRFELTFPRPAATSLHPCLIFPTPALCNPYTDVDHSSSSSIGAGVRLSFLLFGLLVLLLEILLALSSGAISLRKSSPPQSLSLAILSSPSVGQKPPPALPPVPISSSIPVN